MLKLLNPIVPRGVSDLFTFRTLQDGVFYGGAAIGGIVVNKLAKAGVAWGVESVAPRMLETAGAAGRTIGSLVGILVNAWISGKFSRETRNAMMIGAWIETLSPLYSMAYDAVAPSLPEGVRNALGSYYMVPVGAEYATTFQPVGGFAPGDFGEDASPNFPGLAGDIGVAPDFDARSQYAQSFGGAEPVMLNGDGEYFNPSMGGW